jgi:hypothetical protein
LIVKVSILPLTYLADARRQTMVGATPAYSLGVDFADMGGRLVACAVLAVRFFKLEQRIRLKLIVRKTAQSLLTDAPVPI